MIPSPQKYTTTTLDSFKELIHTKSLADQTEETDTMLSSLFHSCMIGESFGKSLEIGTLSKSSNFQPRQPIQIHHHGQPSVTTLSPNQNQHNICTLSCIVEVNTMANHSPVSLSPMEPNLPALLSTMAPTCPANLSAMVLFHLAQPTNAIEIPKPSWHPFWPTHFSMVSISRLTETPSTMVSTTYPAGPNEISLASHQSQDITTALTEPSKC